MGWIRPRAVAAAAAALLAVMAAAETRVVIVAGPSSHPPWSHEVAAGARLMKWALENMANVAAVTADVFYEWPKEAGVLRTADAIVFIGDVFPSRSSPRRR